MCESAKEIQRKWSYENGDYGYDTIEGEASVWFWNHSKDFSDYVWLPRQDQLQEICIEFFILNLKISQYEAFLRFLEWHGRCLLEAFEHGLKNSEYGFIDSNEELLLNNAMTMMYDKKWDGKTWIKSTEDIIRAWPLKGL